MLNLPASTAFNKRIPKQKFYENMTITPALKNIFVNQVKTIYWRNKIAATTTNLAPGKSVIELEVFELQLTGPIIDQALLHQIDKEIPYHILFLLTYQGKCQAWIGYKEAIATGQKSFRVKDYYHTDWQNETDLSLKMEGLSVDAVYENFVRQIAGDALKKETAEETIKESIERDREKKQIEKQIAALERKICKEKQLNRRMEYNAELKKLKKKLGAII